MKYYLAPMEGITGYIYRNACHTYFEPYDKYFLPFIAPHEKRSFNAKERNDLLPEHNEGLYAVPQVLTNDADAFLSILADLRAMGYNEVNLNLGCPSGTVVAKGRGSGFLNEPKKLDEFFARVFEQTDMKISVKTRVGVDSDVVWEELVDIYNRYPLEELIVHPRIQKDFYNGTPRMECFSYAVSESANQLCYNGDIFDTGRYAQLHAAYPSVPAVMLGRGAIRNPGLLGEIKSGAKADKETLHAFHDRLYEDYSQLFSGDRNVLFKMKEVWFYLSQMFEHSEKYAKKIQKAGRAADYVAAVNALFRDCEVKE